MLSPLTKQLIHALCCLPGVGPRSAQRMTFQLLASEGRTKGLLLADTLKQAIEKVGHCKRCRIYTETEYCDLCQSVKRDSSLLCVVENPADVAAIEQSNAYKGLYFVLQGHLSPLDGIGPEEIAIPQLLARIEQENIKELILATNPTMEGEATAHYISHHVDQKKTRCSRIAHGVPMGGELEYLDSNTLSHALLSRTPVNT